MKEELIINGESVDLSGNSGITLNFRSNLFGDISKIQASFSYTVKLPKTTRNRAILDNPGAPAYRSNFRYRRYPVKYLRNGIMILDDAYCVLTSCAENYEIAIYWGGVSEYKQWVDGELKLTDLDLSPSSMVWGSGSVASYPPTAGDTLFDYETGIGSAATIPQGAKAFVDLLPSITCANLLWTIESDMGVTFNYPTWFSEEIQKLAVPILQHKSTTTPTTIGAVTGVSTASGYNWEEGRGIYYSAPASGLYSTEDGSVSYYGTNATLLSLNAPGSVYFDYFGSFRVSFTSTKNFDLSILAQAQISIVKMNSDGAATQIVNFPLTYQVELAEYITHRVRFTVAPAITPLFYLGEDEKLAVVIDLSALSSIGERYVILDISGEVSIRPFLEDAVDIKPGETLFFAQNLPDIKQTDFIKALCGMYGLFLMPRKGESDTFDFVNMSDILRNKLAAVDWSDKLVREYDEEPASMTFKVGEYAQRNLFTYKDDTAPEGYGNGALNVDNASLEEEKDAVKLEFAASQGSLIPIFSYNDDMTEVITESLKPRIMRIVPSTTGSSMLTFEGLSFDTLIGKYYASLQQVLDNAIVLKLKFRLDEVDIAELNYLRPIYLQQYGRYYGLQSLQTSSTQICTAELVQLPTYDDTLTGYLTDKLGEGRLGYMKLGYFVNLD